MLTIIDDAIFLSAEVKTFKGRDESDIQFVEVKFLDGNNDVQKCTTAMALFDAMTESDTLPNRLDEVRIEVEIKEEDGKKGKYLKKKIISIQ